MGIFDRFSRVYLHPGAGKFPARFGFGVVGICCLLYGCASNAPVAEVVPAPDTTITVRAGTAGKPISPELFGIFFEDINYAADGGLYAERVQNRSFEYSSKDRKEWQALTAWELVQRGDGQGSVAVEKGAPRYAGNPILAFLNGAETSIHPNNPHYAILAVTTGGAGVGLANAGFDGIALKAGDEYDVSLFARQLAGSGGPVTVRLEGKNGALLGETVLPNPTGIWTKYSATIEAMATADDARLVVLTQGEGRLALDMISLFPHKTFRNRPNGLRADLAQVIADLNPKFVRFPGGCLVHGDGLDNMYRWKDTIGPLEQRREQRNLWGYHQSVGLGYFEYFQFAEDIGATPLPVVAAGVCCQNSGAWITGKWGEGQEGLPEQVMPAYIQDVLDLVEYANGPVTSTWGARRAAAGHPEPFNLKYLGVGNEDRITPAFNERFTMIYNAVKEKHPEITVIGTVGPFPDGEDYDKGWKIADQLKLPLVDEHGYKPPQWYWDNLERFDKYDRSRSKVYLGEWAAHDEERRTTLRSALAEAAYMTALERNADHVVMASYAPLLAKRGHTQWNPDLIYFTNTDVVPTVNYYMQQLFSVNSGDIYLPARVEGVKHAEKFAFSSVRDSGSGDLILKVVNAASAAKSLRIELPGVGDMASTAVKTVLGGGDPMDVNDFDQPQRFLPDTSTLAVGPAFDYEAPPYSLTIIRIQGTGKK